MRPERYKRIDELFQAAIALDPKDRSTFLNQACADDELRREVEALLSSDEKTDGLLDQSISSRGIEAGAIISHYRIIEKIGEGGMGVVYKAEDLNLNRTVALKFLAADALENAESRMRFIREAKAAAALDHSNVCAIHEIGEAGGHTFLALAFQEGLSLRSYMADRPLKLEEALDIAIQAAQGLQAAHEKGIVHRDVKSSNLTVNAKGQVKILDFGLAQLADHVRLTRTMAILGTPAYMSPEQVQQVPADHRTDIWSLGVVLYEMVTARLPFGGEDSRAVLYAILHDPVQPITALRAGVPMELDRIVGKALAKDRDERYQHMDEFAVDLRNLAKALQSTRSTTRSGLLTAAKQTQERRLKLAVGLLGVSLLAAVVFATVLLRRPTPSDDEEVRRFSMQLDYVRPSISPNGRHIAYRAQDRLWVRDLNSEKPREIPGGKAAGGFYSDTGYYLVWSPDSEEIAFSAEGELRRVSIVQGGSATTICTLPPGRGPGRQIAGLAWSADGQTIVFSRYGGGVYEVPATGGSPKLLWKDDHADDIIILETPNGRALLYANFLGPEESESGHVLVVRTPKGERRTIARLNASWPELVYSPSGHVLFRSNPWESAAIWALPFSVETLQARGEAFLVEPSGQGVSLSDDGTLVYLDWGRSLGQHLAWRDRSGKVLAPAGVAHPNIAGFSLSPDGRQALVIVNDGARDALWIHDLKRPGRRPLAVKFEEGASRIIGGFWSPRGNIYYSLAPPNFSSAQTFVWPSDGLGEARPVRLPIPGEGLRVIADGSADERYFVITAITDPGRIPSIWVWRGGEDKATQFTRESERAFVGTLSPNDRYLAYATIIDNRYEIYVRDFPDGPGIWQISSRGGTAPVWGPDGKELFFNELGTLMSVPVVTNAAQFSAGSPAPLFEHPTLNVLGLPVARYQISRDGKKFLTVEAQHEHPRPVVRVIENWLSEFRRNEQKVTR